MLLLSLFALFCVTLAAPSMNGLHVDGNKIKNLNNEIIQLRVSTIFFD